jgi:hypothetical protein
MARGGPPFTQRFEIVPIRCYALRIRGQQRLGTRAGSRSSPARGTTPTPRPKKEALTLPRPEFFGGASIRLAHGSSGQEEGFSGLWSHMPSAIRARVSGQASTSAEDEGGRRSLRAISAELAPRASSTRTAPIRRNVCQIDVGLKSMGNAREGPARRAGGFIHVAVRAGLDTAHHCLATRRHRRPLL